MEKNYFAVAKIKLLPEGNGLTVLQWEQYVVFTTSSYLRSLALELVN
jgi:hypothetical protein